MVKKNKTRRTSRLNEDEQSTFGKLYEDDELIMSVFDNLIEPYIREHINKVVEDVRGINVCSADFEDIVCYGVAAAILDPATSPREKELLKHMLITDEIMGDYYNFALEIFGPEVEQMRDDVESETDQYDDDIDWDKGDYGLADSKWAHQVGSL